MSAIQQDANFEDIQKAIGLMFREGQHVELRAFLPNKRLSGIYDDFDRLAEDACELPKTSTGVFWTLNPVAGLPVTNCHVAARTDRCVKDEYVTNICNVLVDLDPVRPSHTKSMVLYF